MKFLNSILIFSAFLFLTFTSCKKDDDHDHDHDHLHEGNVTVDFDFLFSSEQLPFELNKEFEHPRLKEKMTFSLFKFYVSNVKLKAKDGSVYTMPESYFLVDADPTTGGNKFVVPNVPGGEYTDIEFMLGVDSLRNTSGAQTGALDPAKGMFWSWNSGYIMVKAEGKAPTAADGTFAFHLGGYKGPDKVQTIRSFNLGEKPLVVDGSRTAEIHMNCNPARLWHSAETLAIKSKQHMPGTVAKTMSGTFYESFKFDHIHN